MSDEKIVRTKYVWDTDSLGDLTGADVEASLGAYHADVEEMLDAEFPEAIIVVSRSNLSNGGSLTVYVEEHNEDLDETCEFPTDDPSLVQPVSDKIGRLWERGEWFLPEE
jgi:hypothetical protein